MFDLLVKGGFVVDGTGSPWFKADVGVRDGKIVEVCRSLPSSRADSIIDAKGFVVCPGFIDMHAHSELAYFVHPGAEAKIMQGVTTEVNCNCGNSGSGPLEGLAFDEIKRRFKQAGGEANFVDWHRVSEYMEKLSNQGVSINAVCLIGFGTIRLGVMGWENRAPTKDELEEMRALTASGMEDGAFGMSTGLFYSPQAFAETDEVVEVAKVVAQYGGFHTSHNRRKGFEKEIRGGRAFLSAGTGDTMIEGVRECIAIGERSGMPSNWTHAKAIGKYNWGKNLAESIKEVYDARRRGMDVTIDFYPWRAKGVAVVLPRWAEEGGREKMVERLKDPETKKILREEIIWRMEGPEAEWGWDQTLIRRVNLEKNKDIVGKSIAEAAEMRGKEPVDLWIDTTVEEGDQLSGLSFAMCEDDIRTFVKEPLAMLSTDGRSSRPPPPSIAHPRYFGTYPKVLRKYVREERIVSYEEAIRKMTSAVASRLGLMDRGLIRPGMWADITVFDPINVRELATYEDPHRYPIGIPYVIVNGVLTVDNGKHTGARAGKPLKHKFYK